MAKLRRLKACMVERGLNNKELVTSSEKRMVTYPVC